MTEPTDYDWNVQYNVGGVTFIGPGMETQREAHAIATIVKQSDNVLNGQNIEVIRQ